MNIPDTTARNFWYRAGADNSPVIIFVHGRASNSRDCWLNVDARSPIFWPALAATEPALAHWAIYLAGYHADDGAGTGIPGCADELYAALDSDPGAPLNRETIVFVAHSLGGIVTRKLIVDHFERFRGQSVFLYLLASPSTGAGLPPFVAALFLRVVGLFQDRTLSKQLTVDRDLLRELDRQFRRLLNVQDDRYLSGLRGAERSESAYIKNIPLLGRLVEHYSTQHYFEEPRELSHESHSTICKPQHRRSPVHTLLVRTCSELRPSPGTRPGRPQSLPSLVTTLQREFRFRFEPPDGETPATPAVYWPVRVRRPTPIHAQQAFVAAALTSLGSTVELWIDDLGNQDYSPENMTRRLTKWFTSVGGQADRLAVRQFTEVLTDDAVKRDAWYLARKWLGDTQQSLDQILRLSKLIPRTSDESTGLDSLLQRRPRRLLTPPIVWLGLRLASRQHGALITLGGEDEVDLWQAWRSLGIDPGVSAGHLYGASLRELQHGERRDVHMRRRVLAWESVDDIWKSFREADAENNVPVNRDTLRAWTLEQCVFLPQYLEGVFPEVATNGRECRSVEEVWNLPPDDRDRAIIAALEKRLL